MNMGKTFPIFHCQIRRPHAATEAGLIHILWEANKSVSALKIKASRTAFFSCGIPNSPFISIRLSAIMALPPHRTTGKKKDKIPEIAKNVNRIIKNVNSRKAIDKKGKKCYSLAIEKGGVYRG